MKNKIKKFLIVDHMVSEDGCDSAIIDFVLANHDAKSILKELMVDIEYHRERIKNDVNIKIYEVFISKSTPKSEMLDAAMDDFCYNNPVPIACYRYRYKREGGERK